MPARYVIHAVGPRYTMPNHAELLASCYRRSLAIARDHGLQTIAFPAISTGIYGYPKREAARIAVRAINAELAAHELPARVILCAFDDETTQILRSELAAQS